MVMSPEEIDRRASELGLTLPTWMPSREQQAARARILAGKFFLVHNDDRWRCRECNRKHNYLTLKCIEQPFSGLDHGVWAYYRTVGATGVRGYLNPAQQQRLRIIERALGMRGDLASSHPGLARKIGTAVQDADVGAALIGVLEPIDKRRATALGRAINARGLKPPFRLPGLNLE